MRSTLLLLLLLFAPVCSALAESSAPSFDGDFWEHWGDGKAELSAYSLKYPRYGKVRKGSAVLIFVTEEFSNSLRVKADPGVHPPDNVFPVMKLNFVQDFQTGIYDYNLLTSSFVSLAPVNGRPAGSPTKISFSSQEWCGHSYHQLLFDENSIREESHSYFDREADRSTKLTYLEDGISEDALFFWARELSGPVVKAGQERVVPLLDSLQTSRLKHRDLVWTKVRLEVSDKLVDITVPAGKFRTVRRSAKRKDGKTWTFWVEASGEKRIVKWQTSDGQSAELLGSKRLKYWQLTSPGGEDYLKKLGL